MPSPFLPTQAEFDRARPTRRAYVVVDAHGLRWVLRPVAAPPRAHVSYDRLRRMAGRFALHVVAERMIAEALSGPTAREAWDRRHEPADLHHPFYLTTGARRG